MIVLQFTQEVSLRLDEFILQNQPGLPKSMLHKCMRQNKIKLNGKKQALGTSLTKGDEVRLYLPENLTKPCLRIAFENEDLLAVEKPAGLPTLCGSGAADGQKCGSDTLLRRVWAYAREGENIFVPKLCHRLDTGTSGLVLVAKNQMTEAFITALIKQRKVSKTYFAVVLGLPNPKSANLHAWLVKDAARALVYINEKKSAEAKKIETHYKTIAHSGRFSLLEVALVTGRTHQIRAHLAHVGHPVLGDGKYGDGEVNRSSKCKYQCLCAAEITFPKNIEQPQFAALAGLAISCEKPWYYKQVLDGTLK